MPPFQMESQNETGSEDNSIVGLHLFGKERLDSSSRYCLRPALESTSMKYLITQVSSWSKQLVVVNAFSDLDTEHIAQ